MTKLMGPNCGIKYVYAPNGRELRTIHTQYTSATKAVVKTTTQKDYAGQMIVKNGEAQMYRFPGGYIEFAKGVPNYINYYVQDYQGPRSRNGRLIIFREKTNIYVRGNCMVCRNGTVIAQRTNYYPSGNVIGNLASSAERQDFKFGGKEFDRNFGLDLYDFEARQYDPIVPAFTSIDPLAEKYYGISPYAYCAGDPVNCVDPDGRANIFINGQHGGIGVSSEYWDGIDKQVMDLTNDHNAIYLDGSCGGWFNTLLVGVDENGKNYNNLSAEARTEAGYSRGEQMAESIYGSLGDDETIKVTTHSMGGAYGKGFVQSLVDYASKNGIEPKIEFELDLAPFQPTEQKAVDGVTTYQASHTNDPVATGEKIPKIKESEIHKYDNTTLNPIKPHSVSTFGPEVDKLLLKK